VRLRNLADLLRQLGDTEPADLLDVAADQEPPPSAGRAAFGQGRRGLAGHRHSTWLMQPSIET
jgi:hypothetical protein